MILFLAQLAEASPDTTEARQQLIIIVGVACFILGGLLGLTLGRLLRRYDSRFRRPDRAGKSGPPVDAWSESAKRLEIEPDPGIELADDDDEPNWDPQDER